MEMYDVIMEKWEYKIFLTDVKGWINKKLDPKVEENMNIIGIHGWELVSIAPLAGNTTTAWGAGTGSFVLVFKRQIKTNVEK